MHQDINKGDGARVCQHTQSPLQREAYASAYSNALSLVGLIERNPGRLSSAHTAVSALGAVSHRETPSSRSSLLSISSRLSRPLRQF